MFLVIWTTFFNIWRLSASPIHDAVPVTVNGLHNNLKREYIIECENADVRSAPYVNGFRIASVRDMCLNYPHGLGAFCSGDNIEFTEPHNPLYFELGIHGGAGITSLCRRLCRCHDIAPDIPSVQNEPANRGEVACSEGEDEVSSSPNTNPISQAAGTGQCSNHDDTDSKTKYPRQFRCDASYYGHPTISDCGAAIRRLPDWGDASNAIRKYFDPGYSSLASDSSYYAQEIQFNDGDVFSFRDKVRAPIMISHGACKVAVMLPEVPGDSTPSAYGRAFVASQALINAAEDLRAECVDQAGCGGKFDHLWYRDGNLLIPNIIMYEKDSVMDDWITLKTTELTSSSESGSSYQTACSGSCLNPNDCDINSDCVCATDKSIPLSTTWGHHACMYLAGAALAHLSAMPLRPYTACRGRCLSEDTGMGNSTQSANLTNHAMTASNTSFINGTRASSLNTSSAQAPHRSAGARPPLITNSTLLTNLTPIAVRPALAGSSDNANIQTTSNATGLTCPCNCTYVSAACCLSPLVWEEPSAQVHMDPMPANGSVCCNATSGGWVPKQASRVNCAMMN